MHSHCLVCLWQKFWNSKRWVRSLFCSIAFMESSSVEISRSMLYISRTWNLGLETQNLFLILHLKRNMKDERSKIQIRSTQNTFSGRISSVVGFMLVLEIVVCLSRERSPHILVIIIMLRMIITAKPATLLMMIDILHRLQIYWDKGNMTKKWITRCWQSLLFMESTSLGVIIQDNRQWKPILRFERRVNNLKALSWDNIMDT